MKRNKGLDRPRSEKPYDKTSCVSVGIEDGKYGDSSRMFFPERRKDSELWGTQKKSLSAADRK